MLKVIYVYNLYVFYQYCQYICAVLLRNHPPSFSLLPLLAKETPLHNYEKTTSTLSPDAELQYHICHCFHHS